MASPIVEINFTEEERDFENMQRQFYCRSDGSQASLEEKNDTPLPSPRAKTAQAPPNAAVAAKRMMSPQKKGPQIITDACKTVYDELRRSLKRVPSVGKEDKSVNKKPSFTKTLADMSGFLDENEEKDKSEFGITPKRPASRLALQDPVKPVSTPPPISLRKPTVMELDEDDQGVVPLIKPQKFPSNEIPSSSSAGVATKPAQRLAMKTSSSEKPVSSVDQATTTAMEDKRQLRKVPSSGLREEHHGGGTLSKAPGSKNRVVEDKQIPPPSAKMFDEPSLLPPPPHDPPEEYSEIVHNESVLMPLRGPQLGHHDNNIDLSSMMMTSTTNQSSLSEMIKEEHNFNDEEEDDDDENGTAKNSSRWLTSKIDNTLYGKIAAIKWSCLQVTEFLEACGLGMYAGIFAENGVDGSTLMELTHDQVKRGLHVFERLHLLSLEMGVDALRHRKIKTVKDWEWSCPRVGEWLEAKGLGSLVGPFKVGAVHGGVLFSLTEDQLVSELGVGRESVLILMSLLASIERAREVGPLKQGDEVPDWAPSRVKVWLESLSLPHLVPVFRQYAVNGALLLHLDAQSMRQEMSVTEIQAIVLEKAINKLRKRQTKRSTIWGSTLQKLNSLIFRSSSSAAVLAAKRTRTTKDTKATGPPVSSLAATYGKYSTKKSSSTSADGALPSSSTATSMVQHKHRHRKQQPSISTTNKMPLTTQQPISPPPSRPPRPQDPSASKAKAAATGKGNNKPLRQPTQRHGRPPLPPPAHEPSSEDGPSNLSIL